MCDDYEDMEMESRLYPWLDDPSEEVIEHWEEDDERR